MKPTLQKALSLLCRKKASYNELIIADDKTRRTQETFIVFHPLFLPNIKSNIS